MRTTTDAEEDRALAVMPRLPRVVEVSTLPDYRLTVRFDDGLEGEVDCRQLITGPRAGVFAALADGSVFAKAHVEHGAVSWPGELDLAPDAMHAALLRDGIWILN
jgi:hypothetical protein